MDKFSTKRESIFGDVDKRNKVLCSAYRYLGNNLKGEVLEKNNVKNLVKFYEHFVKEFVIVESLISSTRRAFKMFERINYRGVGLAENDLAKNYLLELINGSSKTAILEGGDNDVISANNLWNEISNKLEFWILDFQRPLSYWIISIHILLIKVILEK